MLLVEIDCQGDASKCTKVNDRVVTLADACNALQRLPYHLVLLLSHETRFMGLAVHQSQSVQTKYEFKRYIGELISKMSTAVWSTGLAENITRSEL